MAKDKRSENGGARTGAGRKPKIEEISLIERLSPMEDDALKALGNGVRAGEFPFIKLFMEYRYGKPKETIDSKITIEESIKRIFPKREGNNNI